MRPLSSIRRSFSTRSGSLTRQRVLHRDPQILFTASIIMSIFDQSFSSVTAEIDLGPKMMISHRVPLLPKIEGEEENKNTPSNSSSKPTSTFRASPWTHRVLACGSLWIGFVSGFFITLATLGVQILTLSLFGVEFAHEKKWIIGLLWSLSLSSSGLTIMVGLHHMVRVLVAQHGDGEHAADVIRKIIEGHFLLGALASLMACCCWLHWKLEDDVRCCLGWFGMFVVAVCVHVYTTLLPDNHKKNKEKSTDQEEAGDEEEQHQLVVPMLVDEEEQRKLLLIPMLE